MQITSKIVASQLAAYLHHQLSLENLVEWAEQQIMDADFESPTVRNAVARLGLADVRAFGLAWEDCQNLLDSLGYAARVEIAATK